MTASGKSLESSRLAYSNSGTVARSGSNHAINDCTILRLIIRVSKLTILKDVNNHAMAKLRAYSWLLQYWLFVCLALL